jgi:predicted acetyltransferase
VGDDAPVTDALVTDDDIDGVRPLRPDEYRLAQDLFRASLHVGPVQDKNWPMIERSYEQGRVFGAFRDGVLAGSALSFRSELSVPGGAVLPAAMVTRVGVRADQTRRGVLRSLMHAQLTNMTEPFATLRASEGPIYGRFGYGVATRGRTVKISRRRAVPHPAAPGGGRVRLLPYEEALPLITELYRRIGARGPGWSGRPETWWQAELGFARESKFPTTVAVHSGPDGDDGFAVYDVRHDFDDHQKPVQLFVHDLFGGNPVAWAALWRFLVSVDLVDDVIAELRPVDEPLERLFTDPRAVSTSTVDDETWLRLVDVPAALAARSFDVLAPGAGSVVIEVRDDMLPANSGRYRIGDGRARRVDETAELALDVAALAALYLGDVAASALAAVGALTVVKADALRVAGGLFAVPAAPWCGTYF